MQQRVQWITINGMSGSQSVSIPLPILISIDCNESMVKGYSYPTDPISNRSSINA